MSLVLTAADARNMLTSLRRQRKNTLMYGNAATVDIHQYHTETLVALRAGMVAAGTAMLVRCRYGDGILRRLEHLSSPQ